ncbi:MAG TPA: hypothetical protein VJP79_12405 [Nitrososphaera sp.]|nr:hypothetical protein [Nitrososphaera sp.]
MLTFAFVLAALGAFSFMQVQSVDAAKVRGCTTTATPEGVQAASSTEVWVAVDTGTAGKLQKFTNLANNCTDNVTYSVPCDPHYLDRATSTKIAYTQHVGDRVTYYDPGTNVKTQCTGTSLDGAEDIDSWSSTDQYATAYDSGKLVKTVKGSSTCTVTPYTIPGTNPHPEGIDKSADRGGMFVIDQSNNKLYLFNVSSGSFTQCGNTLSSTPRFVAVDDASDLIWITFYSTSTVRWVALIPCTTGAESDAYTDFVYDITVIKPGFSFPVVTTAISSKVAEWRYDISAWDEHDWSNLCLSCTGFGIDSIPADNTYYAILQSTGSPSKIGVGDFP